MSADRSPNRDEQQQGGLAGLVTRAVTSWPSTWRLVIILVVLFALLAGLLWFVPMDIEVGPLRLAPQR